MKKILIFIAAFISITITIKAQDTKATFANKDNVIGLGFGIGGVYGFSGFDSQSPVFGAQYDRGIVELGMGGVIGAGGFIGYKSYANRASIGNNKYKQRYNIIIMGARGTFHYDLFKVKNLDTYGGVMIAYHFVDYTDNLPSTFNYEDNHSNAVYGSLIAGARYYFAPKVSAFAEVGYGVSWLTMGIAFKF